jgi:tetratricopeptide (TPR) repeat protein
VTAPADIEALWRGGRRAEALAAAKAVADAPASPPDPSPWLDLADLLVSLVRDGAAGREGDAAMEIVTALRRRAWPVDEPQSALAGQAMVDWYVRTGRLAEAEAELARARAIAERGVGQTPAPLLALLRASADLAGQAGRDDDAAAFLRRAIEVAGKPRRGPDERGPLYRELSHALLRAGHVDEAADALEASLKLSPKGLSGSEEAEVLARLAQLRERQGNIPAARQLLERAVRACQAELGPSHPHVARHREALARLK